MPGKVPSWVRQSFSKTRKFADGGMNEAGGLGQGEPLVARNSTQAQSPSQAAGVGGSFMGANRGALMGAMQGSVGSGRAPASRQAVAQDLRVSRNMPMAFYADGSLGGVDARDMDPRDVPYEQTDDYKNLMAAQERETREASAPTQRPSLSVRPNEIDDRDRRESEMISSSGGALKESKQTFKQAFASAKDGSVFEWNGKKYKKEYAEPKKTQAKKVESKPESGNLSDDPNRLKRLGQEARRMAADLAKKRAAKK